MKHLRRIFVICLAVVMMCTSHVWAAHPFPSEVYPGKYVSYSAYIGDGEYTYRQLEVYGTLETGIYGTKGCKLSYPITARCFDFISDRFERYDDGASLTNNGGFTTWYNQFYSKYRPVANHAKAWLLYYREGDPEVWCEEYLEAFETYFKRKSPVILNEVTGEPKFRVSDYTWNGNKLSVSCEADYDISYTCKFGYDSFKYEDGEYVTITENGREDMYACVVVTAKEDKDIVYIIKPHDFKPGPEILYKPQECSYDSFINYYKYDASVINSTVHKGTHSDNFDVTLPDFYDPEKHNVSVYFIPSEAVYSNSEILESTWRGFDSADFCNEHNVSEIYKAPETPGDANGDGDVNAADVSVLSKYLSGSSVTISDNADYNGDCMVSSVDLTLLRRKLAGADV